MRDLLARPENTITSIAKLLGVSRNTIYNYVLLVASANARRPPFSSSGVDRDHIHVDTASGAKASRPKLDLVLHLLREGGTLKVTRIDRFAGEDLVDGRRRR